jgi:hypothetical protein
MTPQACASTQRRELGTQRRGRSKPSGRSCAARTVGSDIRCQQGVDVYPTARFFERPAERFDGFAHHGPPNHDRTVCEGFTKHRKLEMTEMQWFECGATIEGLTPGAEAESRRVSESLSALIVRCDQKDETARITGSVV